MFLDLIDLCLYWQGIRKVESNDSFQSGRPPTEDPVQPCLTSDNMLRQRITRFTVAMLLSLERRKNLMPIITYATDGGRRKSANCANLIPYFPRRIRAFSDSEIFRSFTFKSVNLSRQCW